MTLYMQTLDSSDDEDNLRPALATAPTSNIASQDWAHSTQSNTYTDYTTKAALTSINDNAVSGISYNKKCDTVFNMWAEEKLAGHSGPISRVRFSRNGKFIATAGTDASLVS